MSAAKHRAPGPYCDGKPGNGCPRFGHIDWHLQSELDRHPPTHFGCRFLLHYRPKHRAYPCPDDE